MSDVIKIIIDNPKNKGAKPSRKSKKEIVENITMEMINEKLKEYEEVKFKHLKHLHGSWVKCLNNKKLKLFSGGFIVGISDYNDYVTVRCPSKGNDGMINVPKLDNTFYVKIDNENWKAIKELLTDHEKQLYELRMRSSFNS